MFIITCSAVKLTLGRSGFRTAGCRDFFVREEDFDGSVAAICGGTTDGSKIDSVERKEVVSAENPVIR